MYYTLLNYQKDPESGIYHLQSQSNPAFKEMPPQLKVEPNQHKGNVKTDLIIRGKFKKWQDQILTGLAPIDSFFYYGDHYKKGKKSFMLILITPDTMTMAILYFKGFYPNNPNYRESVINDFQDILDTKKGR